MRESAEPVRFRSVLVRLVQVVELVMHGGLARVVGRCEVISLGLHVPLIRGVFG
jgi:hypothetical protein